MCSGFLVRQGKLIQRDVIMFCYYNDAEGRFSLTYMGSIFTWIVGISSLGKFLFLETLIKSLSPGSEMKSRF